MTRAIHLAAFLCAGIVLALGCKKEEPHLATRAPSPPANQQPPMGLPAGHPPIHGQGGMPAMEAMPGGPGDLTWTLPKGWSETKASGMRLATLRPPVAGTVDVSVVALPGLAGGELGNVNRWRGQIGLEPIDDAVREKLRQPVRSPAGEVSLYDLAGSPDRKQRMLAALLVADGKTWFFKAIGDDAPVASAKADFVKLLASLHLQKGG